MDKTDMQILEIMNTIPKEWRHRWCGGEYAACGCMGCVQIGNRIVMWEATTGLKFTGDPEYIDEAKIAPGKYKQYKITKEEWEDWNTRMNKDKDND